MYMLYATQTHGRVYNLHDKLLMHWRNGPKWIYFYFSLMRRFVKKLLQALTLYITFDGQGREKKERERGNMSRGTTSHVGCVVSANFFFFFFLHFFCRLGLCFFAFFSICICYLLFVVVYFAGSIVLHSPAHALISTFFYIYFVNWFFFVCVARSHFRFIHFVSFDSVQFRFRFHYIPAKSDACDSYFPNILFSSHIHPFDGHNIIQSVYH